MLRLSTAVTALNRLTTFFRITLDMLSDPAVFLKYCAIICQERRENAIKKVNENTAWFNDQGVQGWSKIPLHPAKMELPVNKASGGFDRLRS